MGNSAPIRNVAQPGVKPLSGAIAGVEAEGEADRLVTFAAGDVLEVLDEAMPYAAPSKGRSDEEVYDLRHAGVAKRAVARDQPESAESNRLAIELGGDRHDLLALRLRVVVRPGRPILSMGHPKPAVEIVEVVIGKCPDLAWFQLEHEQCPPALREAPGAVAPQRESR